MTRVSEERLVDAAVHACPDNATIILPCCGASVFDLPPRSRIALDQSHVTCGLAPACAACGVERADLTTCEWCAAPGYCECDEDSPVARRSYECGAWVDGMVLCDDCAPKHNGCPICDPD